MDFEACPSWYGSLDAGWNHDTGSSQQAEGFRGAEDAVGHNHTVVNTLFWFIPVFTVPSSNYKS